MEERSKEERKVLYGKSHRFHPVIPFTVDSAPWRPLFLTNNTSNLSLTPSSSLSPGTLSIPRNTVSASQPHRGSIMKKEKAKEKKKGGKRK
jgi:hypothetical protein